MTLKKHNNREINYLNEDNPHNLEKSKQSQHQRVYSSGKVSLAGSGVTKKEVDELEENIDKVHQKLNNEDWDGTDEHAYYILNRTVNPKYAKRLYELHIKPNMEKPIKDKEIDELKHKVLKYDGEIASFKIGIKNLKSNLQSQIEYYESLIKANSSQSEFPDKITEGKLLGLKRAAELLDDGLKHLI